MTTRAVHSCIDIPPLLIVEMQEALEPSKDEMREYLKSAGWTPATEVDALWGEEWWDAGDGNAMELIVAYEFAMRGAA